MLPRNFAKRAAFTTCRLLGLEAWSRYANRGRLLVLCYHGVVAEKHPDRFNFENTVSASEFRAHMEYLSRSFRPVTGEEVLRAKDGGARLPPRAALVTFDDGYRNNLAPAADILRETGVPAVFFVSSGYIGTDRVIWPDEIVNRIVGQGAAKIPGPDGSDRHLPAEIEGKRKVAIEIRDLCKKLPVEQVDAYLGRLRGMTSEPDRDDERFRFMDWEEVRALHGKGFTIGSHTVEHPILTRIGPRRLATELNESRRAIEREIGKPCRFIAYPNGGPDDVSTEVLAGARKAGYELGFTISERFSEAAEDRLALSRICVQGHLPAAFFRIRASGLAQTLRRRGEPS